MKGNYSEISCNLRTSHQLAYWRDSLLLFTLSTNKSIINNFSTLTKLCTLFRTGRTKTIPYPVAHPRLCHIREFPAPLPPLLGGSQRSSYTPFPYFPISKAFSFFTEQNNLFYRTFIMICVGSKPCSK